MELRTFARGGLYGLATLVVEKGVALLLVIGLARALSPDDYGVYSFLVAYLTLFQVLADFGTETILVRRLAADPTARPHTLAAALGLRLALAVTAGMTAVLLAPWLATGEPGVLRRTALAALALLFTAQPGYRALFRAELRLREVLVVASATNVLLLALVVAAVVAGAGLDGVFLAIAAANLSGFAFAALLGRRSAPLRVTVDLALWRGLLREAWPIGANLLVFTIGARIGALLLMRLRGPVEVGHFVSASRLTDALNLLPDAVMLSVYPLFVRFATTRPDELRALAELMAKLLAVALLVVVLLVSQLADQVMGGLFRPEFAVAGPALAQLSWSALLAALGSVYGHLLVAVGRQNVLFRVNAAGAVLQVVLQAVLIARLGVWGAALAVVLTSVATHTALYLLVETRTWVRPCVRAVAPAVLLAGAAIAAAPLLPLPPYARAAVLLAVFLAALLATRQLGPADAQRLRTVLRERASAAPAGVGLAEP